MQNCLVELNLTYCLIYFNDVIVFLKTEEEHLHHLHIAFEHFREHNLKLMPTKCKFFKSETNYLAHHVLREGRQPSKENLETVADIAWPWTYTDIQASMGLVGFYRWFIKGFACIVQPLHKHLSGEGASKMNEWVTINKICWVPSRLPRRPALRPLCWLLTISTSHSSSKLTQASKDRELCYHRKRWMDDTIQWPMWASL